MEKDQDGLRDYSLIGIEADKTIRLGLANAQWYQSPVPGEQMRKLLIRKNGPAIRDTLIWFSLIFGSAFLVFILWGTWFVILPYLVYSVLYASTSDSRWHESSHGTAFKTDWMNNALYEIASFMVFRQATVWRWSHTRHHSDTIIRGRDPEIAVPRPPQINKILLGFIGVSSTISEAKRIFRHAFGNIDPEVATYVPLHAYRKIFFQARLYISIYLAVIILSITFRTFLPLMFIGLPTFLGGWLMPVYGLTQHAGLQENVLDHRLNCRTVYMNRVNRFLYWNMNYHVEHHMYPLVPYHALPDLHKVMKDDCPKPYTGIIEAWREIIPAIRQQVKNPAYYVERKLPEKSQTTFATEKKVFTGENSTVANGKIEVCGADELSKGEIIRFDFEQKTYAIYRTSDNTYYASEGICTHGNTHLADGVIIGDQIECSKHNGRFNLKDGLPGRMPVCIGIKTYKVNIEGDKIYLELPGNGTEHRDESDFPKTFRVVTNYNVATFIKELVLEPDENFKFNYVPGQYIQMVIPPFETTFDQFEINEPFNSVWKKPELSGCYAKNLIYTKRNYSMATNPEIEMQLKFNIRIALPPTDHSVSAGAGSSYVFNLKPGDKVQLTGPFGDFQIKQSVREMIYLGGGAGMAPLRSHLSYLFETLKTNRKVSFWYGARSLADLYYTAYFDNLVSEHDNFSFKVALSDPKQNDDWTGQTGFIHEYLLNNYLVNHKAPDEIEYYLCGPPEMVKAGLEMLKKLGVADRMIAFDEF